MEHRIKINFGRRQGVFYGCYCCCCSVAKLYPTLCSIMDYTIPAFPVLHYLPEFAQIHLHWVGEVKWSEVAQSSLTLCNPMDCSPPGFSVHGIFQARILEWVAISFSMNWWCYLTISSSATPFFFCVQSLPPSRYFLVSWFFPSGGQSIGASTSTSVLPVSIQGWVPLGLNGLIFLHSKGLSRVFSNTTISMILLLKEWTLTQYHQG